MFGGRLSIGALPLGKGLADFRGGRLLSKGRDDILVSAPNTVRVGEADDLEALGRLEERVQLVLRHDHLAAVHELQQGGHVVVLDVSQDDDGVLTGVALGEKAREERGSEQRYSAVQCSAV